MSISAKLGTTNEGREAAQEEVRVGRFSFGPRALLRVALIATALAYVQTVTYSFVFDDLLQIEMNPWIQSWRHWRDFFTGHVWSFGSVPGNFYRPVFLFWLTGNYSLFRLTPGWWHLSTIAAHLVATGMVYALASRLLRSRWSGAMGAALFGLYPLHIECVAWVSGVPEVLLTIFFVGALLAFQNWQQGKKTGWLVASLATYMLALLSKETALAFVAVLAVYVWVSDDGAGFRSRVRNAALCLAPFLATTLAYLVLRNLALGGFASSNFPRPMSWVLATWPSALWFYVRQMIWPFQPSAIYDFDLVRTISLASIVLPLLLAALGVTGFVLLGRRSRLGSLTGIWILAPLLPALIGIRVFPWHDYVHDRYTYLPSVMVAIVVAAGIQQAATWAAKRTTISRLRMEVVGATVLAVAFGAATVIQSRQWETDLALFTHAHERAPRNPLPLDYMARSLYGLGRTDEAIDRYHEVLRLDPDSWQGNYILGLAYYQLGRYEDAEKYLKIATEVWPRDYVKPEPAQFYYLGLIQQRKGEMAQAEVSFRKAVELRPRAPGYRAALANILRRRGQEAEAAEQMRLEVENRKAAAEREREFER